MELLTTVSKTNPSNLILILRRDHWLLPGQDLDSRVVERRTRDRNQLHPI